MEFLEARTLLATRGIPWNDPRHLTLSLAPDGTGIAGHVSNLFQTLGAHRDVAAWQSDILRAFQTWAVQSNINVGLVADGGHRFGTPGDTQGDTRFGDIRVGAHQMSREVLSISVAHDPFLSGTWAGDVMLNSSYAFDGTDANLFSTMLHEAGHSFGLGHSSDPNSVIFSHANSVTRLSQGDIAAIQSLYGTRAPDKNELTTNNDTFGNATRIKFSQVSDGYDGSTPLVVYGDITRLGDVDVFSLKPLVGYNGPVTFRLQTSGVSLLAPRLTVYDSAGNVLGQSQSTNPAGDVVTVTLARQDPKGTFVKVEGASGDAFGIGSYGLVATFDASLTVSPDVIDAVVRSPFENLLPHDVNEVFVHPSTVAFNDDLHGNDTFASAISLKTTPGFAQNTHYATVAGISDPTDLDVYRIKAANVPSGVPNVLTATVRAMDVHGATPRIALFDGNLNAVSATVLANGNGTYTIQLASAKSGANYFLRLGSTPADGSSLVGNYSLTVDFGRVPANLAPFASGTLSDLSLSNTQTLYVAQSQLFQFVLSATAPATDASVRMTIFDEVGTAVFTLSARAGDTVSSTAQFLAPGAYTVRFTAETPTGSLGSPMPFSLSGGSITDPIGPVLSDPTLTPSYTCPTTPGTFCYPGGITSTTPFIWVPPKR